MFESLFTCPGALRRHRKGPLAVERAAYLSELEFQGVARGTILRRSSYCLCVAVEIQRWPPNQCFDEEEIEALTAAWAAGRFASGKASSPRWPKEHFRFAATDFLRSLGRLRPTPSVAPGRYDAGLAEFIASQQEGRWQSEATCQSGRWQVERFIAYLEQRGVALSDVTATVRRLGIGTARLCPSSPRCRSARTLHSDYVAKFAASSCESEQFSPLHHISEFAT